MNSQNTNSRLIAMGHRALMEGFALLGFETIADADTDSLENLLDELVNNKQSTFLLLESYLSASESKILQMVRNTANHILIAEIPAINEYDNYHPHVEKLIAKVLGQHILDDENFNLSNEAAEAELEKLNHAEQQFNKNVKKKLDREGVLE
ncbi:MAG: hypothetical protein HQL46_01415 [Gammaproteobacteria bacterium]|nr:hypothetical protein [Gammaproteobacteria bacterium]